MGPSTGPSGEVAGRGRAGPSAEVIGRGHRMEPGRTGVTRGTGGAGDNGRGSGEIDNDGDVIGGALALALVAVDGGAGDTTRQSR